MIIDRERSRIGRLHGRIWRIASTSTLVRNAGWLLLGHGGRLITSGLYFVIIGRALGVAGFGAFAAALAVVMILEPFAGWGSDKVLVMQVARNPSRFAAYWGNVLLVTALTGVAGTLLATLFGVLFLPALPVPLVIAVAVSLLIFGALRRSAASAFQAFERLKVSANLLVLDGVMRLVAAGLFVLVISNPTPEAWSLWYLASWVIPAVIGLGLVTREFGRPQFLPSLVRRHVLDGWNFAVGVGSASVYNDIDKALLARLATLEAAGIYAAAYRVVDMASMPITAVLGATYARFFRDGASGIEGSKSFARRILPISGAYGILATAGLIVVAPVVPSILGSEYADAVTAIQLLAVLTFLRSLHRFAADTITGAGFLGTRSVIQVGVAFLNVLLSIWLITAYSWRGAIVASIITEVLLLILFWVAIQLLSRREAPFRTLNTASKPRASTPPS